MTDKCVLWMGAKNGDGYGVVRMGYRFVLTHRRAWWGSRGAIPYGLQLGHLCHDRDLECPGGKGCKHRACMNPNHLQPMTPAENNRARAARNLAIRRARERKTT